MLYWVGCSVANKTQIRNCRNANSCNAQAQTLAFLLWIICKLIAEYITIIYKLNFRSEWTIIVNYERLLQRFQSVNQIWRFYLFAIRGRSLVQNLIRVSLFERQFHFICITFNNIIFNVSLWRINQCCEMNTINLLVTWILAWIYGQQTQDMEREWEMSNYFDWKTVDIHMFKMHAFKHFMELLSVYYLITGWSFLNQC